MTPPPPRPPHRDPERALFDQLARQQALNVAPTPTAVANITRAHRHRQAQAAALTAALQNWPATDDD